MIAITRCAASMDAQPQTDGRASLIDDQLHVLAEEQAALRRVATLVARGVPPEELFAAVTQEFARLLDVQLAGIARYETTDTLTVLATWAAEGEHPLSKGTWPLDEGGLAATVKSTGRPVRIDSYRDVPGRIAALVREESDIGSSVACPIIVEGRLWGAVFVHSKQLHQPLPPDTESRLTGFTELVGTAIANAESRSELARLAEEQAALRRVATLVARGVPPEELFAAVTAEFGQLLRVHLAGLARYEGNDTLTVLATWANEGDHPLVPGPWPLEGGDVATAVRETGRPVRIDDYREVAGRIAAYVREERGIVASVGSPIAVEGRLWGVAFVHSKQIQQPLPPDTESRLRGFTELLATAISNAESRAQLTASRARIAAAADETRRRIERDLHDGTQQRLVSLGLELRAAQATVPPQLGELDEALSRVATGLASVFEELREISHGIHPAILSDGGLERALRALRRRSAVPVELDVHADRPLPEPVEVALYYVVSEALANAAKHSQASVVNVGLDTRDAILRLAIGDDGIGGADLRNGSGLLGLSDRVEALGGTLQLSSPAGYGTTLLIEVPLEDSSRPLSYGQ
jgi:signal transduction histidine kinase